MFQGKGKPRACWSNNYYEPSPDVERPICGSCNRCPAAVYGRRTDEKDEIAGKLNLNLPPSKLADSLCKEINDLLLMDKNNVPFIMQFKGTSKIALEKKLKPQLTKAKAQKIPMCCVEFDIVSEKRTSKGGDEYFAIDLDNFRLSENPQDRVGAYKVYSSVANDLVDEMHTKHSDMDKENMSKPGGPPPFDNDDQIPF